ncbi:MAG: TonB-dependent receptor [Myxococcota bacterium]|nr:TonB-dependent receptor [Myxococcota bacterium]
MTRGSVRVAAMAVVVARRAGAEEPIAPVGSSAPSEVEVHGEQLARPAKEPTVAGSVIREERLRAPGLQAGDVLRTQPGVAVADTGGYGSLSTASIRGATAAQTPVYLGGVRLNDDVGGTADLSLVPLWLVHRVEIYRSNAPLEGDQLGIGGAILFEPRRPKGTEAETGVMGGSFGAYAVWAGAGLGDAKNAVFLGARLEGAKNDYAFVNDHGTRFEPRNERTELRTNADASTADVWAMGTARVGAHGRVDGVANDVEREQGLPGLTIFPSTRARVRFGRRLAAITTELPCGSSSDRCVVTAGIAGILSRSTYEDPLREAGLLTTRLDIHATRVEESVLVRARVSDRLSVAPALRASIERLAVETAAGESLHAERLFVRAAVQGQWAPSDAVTARAIGSAECHGTSLDGMPPWSLPGDATGASRGGVGCDSLQPAARLGVEVGQAPLALLANAGRYVRVPTLTELYGMSGAVRGNTALTPETGLSFDAGLRASAPASSLLHRASIDVFGFLRTAAALIAYQRSPSGYVRPFNVGSARVAGLEILTQYEPIPAVLFELSATLLDARNTSPVRPVNDVLPFLPRLTMVPRVEVHGRLRHVPVESAKLSLSYFYVSNRYADAAGLDVIPEQGSLDLEGQIGALHDRLTLRARLANVLDGARFDLIGYPLPGRAAYVALEAQW